MVSRVVWFAILALVTRTGVALAAPTANLSAMDFADHATVSNGDTVIYTLIATNNGPDTAIAPKLVDTVQASMDFSTVQFLDGTEPGGGTVLFATDLATRTATCTIQGGGQLALGEALRCRFTVQATGVGTSVNNVLATNDLEDPADTGNTGSASTFIQDPPPPTFAPTTIALGSIASGGVGSKAVVATNPDSTVFLNVKSIAASCGTHAACTITPDTCTGMHVTPLATCGFTLVATCTSTGAITGSVTFTDFSTGSPESLPITGICASPSTTALVSSAPSAPFGTSVTFTATVSAGATGTVAFFDGATSVGSSTLTAATATLATSTLFVGAHTITATYSGDAAFGASTSEALAQTITPVTADFSIAASPQSLTITSGASATATLTLTPTGGFTGTIALACSDLPADASCLFAPATANLDGAPATVQLTVDTALAMAQTSSRKTGGGRGALLLFGAVGFFGKRRRAGKLLLVLGVLACGGGATPHSTPPGSYAITVTASGAMTHATTIAVVVE